MGREVRRVPANWEHPKDNHGSYQPLYDEDFETVAKDWLHDAILWSLNEHPDQHKEGLKDVTDKYAYYWQWASFPPDEDHYRPTWPEESRTHIQMYETTTEGTPISPVMKTPEELARWLADNNASAFGSNTATYEQWLDTIRAGGCVSAVMIGGQLISGVEAESVFLKNK